MGGLFEERRLALEEPQPGKMTGARSQPFVKKLVGGLQVDELNTVVLPAPTASMSTMTMDRGPD